MNEAPGSGAASVATQLVAFYREPARWRPRYLHGQDPLPEGQVVLKFALGRFSHGWQRDLSAHDRGELVQAARAFVRQVCLWERATPYQLLCLEPGATREQVKESYRLLMALMHPDRGDPAHEWPADGAQRVNEAYALLSDEGRRNAFDAGARRAHPAATAPEAAAHSGGHAAHLGARAGGGYGRRILVVGAMLLVVFVIQALWMREDASHYGLLERALPGKAPNSWMHGVLPEGTLPRFMESRPVLAFDPLELLPPPQLPRLAPVALRMAPSPAGIPAPAAAPAPPGAARVSPPAVEPLPSVVELKPAASVPAPAIAARPQAAPLLAAASVTPEPVRLAQAAPVPVAPVASARAPAARAAAAPTSQDIENLVASLVSAYESGDVDGLMGLFDPDELGFWQGFRTRGAYSDFFRATRQRRLRMDRLQWTTEAGMARAQGSATVVGDMADGSGRLERKTEVSLEIGMRAGQPRIVRLALYPDAR